MQTSSKKMSVKKFVGLMNKGKIIADSYLQRNFVWTVDQNSKLIHSAICGYPIPTFYCVVKPDGVLDQMDGKQRGNAFRTYLEDGFALKLNKEDRYIPVEQLGFELEEEFQDKLTTIKMEVLKAVDDIETGDKTLIAEEEEVVVLDINGMKFSQLPKEVREVVEEYNISIEKIEKCTEKEKVELFARLNNGKALTTVENIRVKAISQSVITDIANHELFSKAFSPKQINGYANESVVMNLFTLLNFENADFSKKTVGDFIANNEVTEEEKARMLSIFDKINEITGIIELNTDDAKATKKMLKKIYNKTNLVSLGKFIDTHKDVDIEELAQFVDYFFGVAEGTSINEDYNDCVTDGSGKSSSIRTRNEALEQEYLGFIQE